MKRVNVFLDVEADDELLGRILIELRKIEIFDVAKLHSIFSPDTVPRLQYDLRDPIHVIFQS